MPDLLHMLFSNPFHYSNSSKQVLLKTLEDLQENTCARVSFVTKLQVAYKFTEKRLRHKRFPVNFAEFPRTSFLQRPLNNCFRTVIVGRLNFHTIESLKVLSSKYSPNNTKKVGGLEQKNDRQLPITGCYLQPCIYYIIYLYLSIFYI